MTARAWPWLVFPTLGIALGWIFRPAVDLDLPLPEEDPVEIRTLALPDGRALRFRRGPGQAVFLCETEIPPGLYAEFSDRPPSHPDARAFCDWLGERTRARLRLPTAAEWRAAARAGVPNAEFAWGFGPPEPPHGVAFARATPPARPGPPFGHGFRDLAGGRWEWTAEGLLLGSAWSESDPRTLYIDHEFHPPEGYRGADAGIRPVWDLP